MVDIRTIGAGGGSIAWIDAGGLLRVGPQSAGSTPGPACYGKGGTEADPHRRQPLLGRLNPDAVLRRRDPARRERSRATPSSDSPSGSGSRSKRRRPRSSSSRTTTWSMRCSVISVEQGIDPREFTLVAFGGAGAASRGRHRAHPRAYARCWFRPYPGQHVRLRTADRRACAPTFRRRC